MIRRFVPIALIAALLTACTGSLWGSYATPTPSGQALILPTATLFPTFTPAPTRDSNPPPPVTQTPGAPTGQVQIDPTPTANPLETGQPQFFYTTQGGDYLPAVARRFSIDISLIRAPEGLNPTGHLNIGTLLIIPNTLGDLGPGTITLPDSEIVYGPAVANFDVNAYVLMAGGKLAAFRQYLGTNGWTSGAESIHRIALDHSLNPRLILAILDYESNWVRANPTNLAQEDYPLGYINFYYKELYRQMMWAAEEISLGYYGWRSGTLTELTFPDGVTIRMDPRLNAGTAAIQYFFSKTHKYADWLRIMDPNTGFPAFYAEMFGDPWQRAAYNDPVIPPGLDQPPLALPFEFGKVWSYSGGPHAPWDKRGALAALDFAPAATDGGCEISNAWVVAPAPGQVVRVDKGLVVLDLDGDGSEQTGWNLIFLHIATSEKARPGQWLNQNDRIGHPSCEGGVSTGTHVHIARKYNGEWVLAEGPIPFNLSGWVASNGSEPYKGTLTRGETVIEACACGSFETRIVRQAGE